MAREYKKIFQTDKSKPTYHFLSIQQVPILSCPECSSIKASMCSDCGTFMCTNLHKTNPNKLDEPYRYYYYDNKKGQVKEGHDPTCQKHTSAEEIAKRVVELLAKEHEEKKEPSVFIKTVREDMLKDKSLGKVTDLISPYPGAVPHDPLSYSLKRSNGEIHSYSSSSEQDPLDDKCGLFPNKKSKNEILAEKSKPGPLYGRHSYSSCSEPLNSTPDEHSQIVHAATLSVKEKMDALVDEFIDWQTGGQTENYDYSKLTIDEVAQFLRAKEEQKTSDEGERKKPVDPISLFSETVTRLRDQDNHNEGKKSESESECEEANCEDDVKTLTENIIEIQKDYLSKQTSEKMCDSALNLLSDLSIELGIKSGLYPPHVKTLVENATNLSDMSKVDESNDKKEEVNELAKVSDVPQTSIIYEPVVDPGCLYPNFRSRTMGQGDIIRGDLRIAPDNNSHHSQWFHVNVKPERDLRKGLIQLDGIDKDGFLNTPAE